MEEKNKIQLSILDIENKYIVDPDENVYGNRSLVTWGLNNDLPVLYKNCYNKSATLKSIIDGTISYILGDDVIVKDKAAKWGEKVNRSGMTMRQFISKLAFNYLVYGGFAIQVIYNKLGFVCEMYPIDFGRCRTNENGTKIYYSKKKWTKYQTTSDEYDAFDPSNINFDNPTQIFYFKGDYTSSVYPLPPYAGALYDVLTEIECSKYSLNTVARGFSAKYVFNMPDVGNLTDEQKEGMNKAIKNKFCGTESESNFMLYWKDGENDGIDIKKIEGDETPERYIAIKDNARQNIFVSMRATPLLFGLPNASNGFSTQEYSDSFKLFQKTVVEPIQDVILESIDKIISVEDGVEITTFNINFDNNETK